MRKTKTSIGHHTFTMSRRITGEELNRGFSTPWTVSPGKLVAASLLKDVSEYKQETEEIDILIPIEKSSAWRPAKKTVRHDGKWEFEHFGIWKIVYTSEHLKGLNWILRYNTYSSDFCEYTIEARINSKVFVGTNDFITASDDKHLLFVEKRFNIEAKKISPILGQFYQYMPKRIDFCINFDLKELSIQCTPEQMMYLIKKSDYPSHFKELQYYDKKSYRYKAPDKNTHYLKSGSVNINCYYKHPQLMKQFPSCPDIEDAQHVIRFEVQCLYSKTYQMKKQAQERAQKERELHYATHRNFYDDDSAENMIYKRLDTDPLKIIRSMLSDVTAETIINKYFNQMIKPGDYHTLATAIKMVEDANIHPVVEHDIIQTLESINRIGIVKTRALIQPQAMPSFYRTLGYLAKMGINPVTIPKSFKVKHFRTF